QNKIRFREDATNALASIQRNRIRQELLPLLRRHYQPALDQTVIHLMDILGAEAALTAQIASEWLKNNRRRQRTVRVASTPSPSLTDTTAPFENLPIAAQRRCLHQQLLGLG